MLNDELRQHVTIPPEEIQAYYDAHRDEFTVKQEKYKLAQILMAVPPNATPAEVAAAKAKAEEARKKAVAGEDFSDLAKRYSDDESKTQRRRARNVFGPDDIMDEILVGIKNLQPGQVSEVIQHQARLPHHQGRAARCSRLEATAGGERGHSQSPGRSADARAACRPGSKPNWSSSTTWRRCTKVPRKHKTPLLAISMGDPAGIGPEVALKSVASFRQRGDAPEFVVIGDLETMRETADRIDDAPNPVPWHPGEKLPRDGLAVMSMTQLSASARRPGQPSLEGGDASFRYVEAGAKMARDGDVDALVTAPISKQWWHRAGHRFPGHSEVMAKVGRSRNWRMMFAGSELRLALVTVHVGLAKVPALLNAEKRFRHYRDPRSSSCAKMKARWGPASACSASIRMAGRTGLFGDEETRIIAPAIRQAQKRGIDAHGPLAPDTAFVKHDGRFGFDAAVTMYHDQGLIALKTLEFDRAVNITIGLPFIRTSPDHGTAFDIAGRGSRESLEHDLRD